MWPNKDLKILALTVLNINIFFVSRMAKNHNFNKSVLKITLLMPIVFH